MEEVFTGSFTQQPPIPDEAVEAAVAVMRSGRLHRYNLVPGEAGEVALLEAEFAALTGARHALAVASGGYALAAALRALDVQPGEPVLSNAFTLAPVPGAIASVGARPVFVEVTEALTIDLDDLAAKLGQARVLLLSHMRGHVCDMDRLMALCDAAGVTVVEDCAHTMGASWRGVPSGRHGAIGCYSTQTYKHVNSGEGGLIVTDDADLAARLILGSGSYMHYGLHGTAPPAEAFEAARWSVPNVSGRMDNVRAAILRPQLRGLDAARAAWLRRYRTIEDGLRGVPGLTLIERQEAEAFVGSSLQFLLLDWSDAAVARVVERCAARGVSLKWFGAPEPQGFTATYRHWRFASSEPMPRTDRILRAILDMRLPLTFSLDDCMLIARIIAQEVGRACNRKDAAQ
ncbi:DegT/DnrJ/EryC1/StrS family aminotransferase [Roseitranquillus sediminis]|uniref:DegT/DnrJ/EryC1/StrS family aminotransferase n=1 Tax=Roseitranquillus sediminis TaxID=2809051 RepID=UPI001D0C2CE2|nr:aminotransferase class I/II-fold pyridoxal phosphate-dependent enzyme [Roseitranquillus sediminis]MBM9594128.1 aminotransferase class I/II-fold pyridoxal phosphate-dependent enzyme [Roseitranquillus sediminis]